MNTQKVKQASEMTNAELYAELKERGFFLMPDPIKDGDDLDTMVVSVSLPKRDIWFTRKHGIESKPKVENLTWVTMKA